VDHDILVGLLGSLHGVNGGSYGGLGLFASGASGSKRVHRGKDSGVLPASRERINEDDQHAGTVRPPRRCRRAIQESFKRGRIRLAAVGRRGECFAEKGVDVYVHALRPSKRRPR